MSEIKEKFEKHIHRLNKIPFSNLDGLMVSPSTSYEYISHPKTGNELRVAIQFSRPTSSSPKLGTLNLDTDLMIHVGPHIEIFMENSIKIAQLEYVVTFHASGDFNFHCYKFNINEPWFNDWLLYNMDRIIAEQINHAISIHKIYEDSKISNKISNKIKKIMSFLD